ncbi:hypothetical protein AFL01nite_28900 [Aeromicrobium flavum]|uniref:Uncharacterized protein n=1 Tax=Aeromicrobium flavum TaxID=416568 RepID=A0A512HYM7_9ACTN|nr:hypothetical protein [Aeromicrobium flavum]GEO90563.1 hypothetical protein AFL01nite_28900 [Aeromicrobium flavum]
MAWWQASQPEVVVAPSGDLLPGSVRARRFVDRELVQPGPNGRLLWSRLAEVLATVGDVRPLSLYETTADDVTSIVGPSVHCYFRDGDVLVESVDPEGWRRFTFHPEALVLARLVMGLATIVPPAGRLMACTLADGRDGVLLADGENLLLGDLPVDRGAVRDVVRLSPEDVQLLLLARLRLPQVA